MVIFNDIDRHVGIDIIFWHLRQNKVNTMYSKTALLMLSGLAASASAFQPAAMSRAGAIAVSRQFTSSTAALGPEATKAAVEGLYKAGGAHAEQKFDADFDAMVKAAFPGAMSNQELETKVVGILSAKGYSA